MYIHIHSHEGKGIPSRSFTRATTRDQIVDIKGSRAFPALLHKVQVRNEDGEVAYSQRRNIERTSNRCVLISETLTLCTAVLYCLYAFRMTKVVDTWKLLRTNVGHTALTLECA